MALQTFVGSLAQPSSTGNQAITGVGFKPIAVIFFANTSTADGSIADEQVMMGMATSSANRATVSGGHANSSTNQYRSHNAGKCIALISTTGSVLSSADFVSMDSDGFTINWSNADATARIVNFIAIGGSDVTNVFVKQFTAPTVTGNQGITGVGFKPDALILMSPVYETAPPNTDTSGGGGISLGFAVSSTQRGGIGFDATPESLQKAEPVCSANSQEADLVSLDSDGFTLHWSVVDTVADYWYALCLKGGQYSVGSDTQKTSTGTKANTAPGFQPTGLLLFSQDQASSTSVQTTARFSFGAASDTTHRGAIWSGQTASGNSDQNLDRTKVIKMMTEAATPTTQASADLSSFDTTGFTLNWGIADATAREFIYLVLGNNKIIFNEPNKIYQVKQAVNRSNTY